MKTYKIKSTIVVDIETEIAADSEEDAKAKFYSSDIKDVIGEADRVYCSAGSRHIFGDVVLYFAKFEITVYHVEYVDGDGGENFQFTLLSYVSDLDQDVKERVELITGKEVKSVKYTLSVL